MTLTNTRRQRICCSLSAAAFSCAVFSVKNDHLPLMAICLALTCLGSFALAYYAYPALEAARASSPGRRTDRILAWIFALAGSALYTKNSALLHPRVAEEFDLAAWLGAKAHIAPLMLRGLFPLVSIVLFLMLLPIMRIAWYCLVARLRPAVLGFFKSLSTFERVALAAFFFVILCLSCLAAVRSPAFLLHTHGGKPTYQGIFGADSAYLVYYDYFASPILDDLRHPLMGIVAMPAGMLAWGAGLIIFLLSGAQINIHLAYGMGWAAVQSLMVGFAGVFLSRMLREGIGRTLSRAVLVCFLCSSPSLLYALTIERYAVTIFCLLLFLFVWQKGAPRPVKIAAFFCAVGTMAPSALLLPAALASSRENQESLSRRAGRLLLWGGATALLTGRLAMLLNTFATSGGFLQAYASFVQPRNLPYYLDFVRSLFFIPAWELHSNSSSIASVLTAGARSFSVILCAPAGLLCALGIYRGRRQPLIQAAGAWILLSMVLIGVLGLGVALEETVLYSLYFSWAFLAAMATGAHSLLGPKASALLLPMLSAGMAAYNLWQLLRMIG